MPTFDPYNTPTRPRMVPRTPGDGFHILRNGNTLTVARWSNNCWSIIGQMYGHTPESAAERGFSYVRSIDIEKAAPAPAWLQQYEPTPFDAQLDIGARALWDDEADAARSLGQERHSYAQLAPATQTVLVRRVRAVITAMLEQMRPADRNATLLAVQFDLEKEALVALGDAAQALDDWLGKEAFQSEDIPALSAFRSALEELRAARSKAKPA